MKRLLIILSLPFMVNTSLAQDSRVETITIKTSIACSHCMACGSCGARIDSHIQEGKGIRKVKINPELNTIEVTYNEQKTTPSEIRNTIAAAGYDADDVKATKSGFSELDGCCKSH